MEPNNSTIHSSSSTMSYTSTSISSYGGSYSSVDDEVIKCIPAITSSAGTSKCLLEESNRGPHRAKDDIRTTKANGASSASFAGKKDNTSKALPTSQSESVSTSTGPSSDDIEEGFERDGFQDEPAQYFFEEPGDSNANADTAADNRTCPSGETENSRNISGISVHKSALKNGLGLFSDRDVQRGELLFTEKPLVTHGLDMNYDTRKNPVVSPNKSRLRSETNSLSNQMEELVDDLSEADKAAYYALSCDIKANETGNYDARRIFADSFIPYNMNDVVGNNCVYGGAVFAIASRLNHSCIPNLQHSWDDVNEIELFFAAKDISKGEELTIAYVDPVRKRRERQCDLWNIYNFECNCEACDVSEAQRRMSDFRRARLCALDQQVYHAVDTGEYEHAVNLIDERMRVLKDEGLDTPKNLLRCEYDGYIACLNGGDIEGMHTYLTSACKHAKECFGEESLVVCRLKMKVQELGFHTSFML